MQVLATRSEVMTRLRGSRSR